MTRTPTQTIELLPVSLLDENRGEAEALKRLAHSLRLEFGWHYMLDLTWILRQLGPVSGKRILEAGAGTGVLQWRLAGLGAEVISVDRLSRASLPLRFRRRFNVTGLRPGDLNPVGETVIQAIKDPARGSIFRRLAVQAREIFSYWRGQPVPGRVSIYNQDLSNLLDIPDDSIDVVVSVSALEHNTPDGLQQVVQEIMRVLKPGGVLLATLTAGKERDQWHAPSSGWCYTDVTLRRLFELPVDTHSNYAQYDALFDDLKNCAELRDNLARFYFTGEDKGMPNGTWDPQYQPVGVCKIK